MSSKAIIKTLTNPLVTAYYLVISIVLAIIIATVYRKTHKSVSYSSTFVNSLVLLLPIVTIVINIVNNNVARAIGVFGAFSITRFRTPIKDSKDMVYIFWCLATGLAIGAGEIGIAVTSTLALSLLSLGLYYTNFGSSNNFDYLLVVNLNVAKTKIEDLNKLVGKYAKDKEIINIQSDKSGQNLEICENIKLKRRIDINDLLSSIQKLKGVKNINISPIQSTVEF